MYSPCPAQNQFSEGSSDGWSGTPFNINIYGVDGKSNGYYYSPSEYLPCSRFPDLTVRGVADVGVDMDDYGTAIEASPRLNAFISAPDGLVISLPDKSGFTMKVEGIGGKVVNGERQRVGDMACGERGCLILCAFHDFSA